MVLLRPPFPILVILLLGGLFQGCSKVSDDEAIIAGIQRRASGDFREAQRLRHALLGKRETVTKILKGTDSDLILETLPLMSVIHVSDNFERLKQLALQRKMGISDRAVRTLAVDATEQCFTFLHSLMKTTVTERMDFMSYACFDALCDHWPQRLASLAHEFLRGDLGPTKQYFILRRILADVPVTAAVRIELRRYEQEVDERLKDSSIEGVPRLLLRATKRHAHDLTQY